MTVQTRLRIDRATGIGDFVNSRNSLSTENRKLVNRPVVPLLLARLNNSNEAAFRLCRETDRRDDASSLPGSDRLVPGFAVATESNFVPAWKVVLTAAGIKNKARQFI